MSEPTPAYVIRCDGGNDEPIIVAMSKVRAEAIMGELRISGGLYKGRRYPGFRFWIAEVEALE